MPLFDKLFKPKNIKWKSYLDTRPKKYYELTPSSDIKINRSFSQLNAQTYYKQYNDSLKLIGTTKKPDVFFERYDFAITRLIGLIYMKKYIRIEGSNLPEAVEKMIDHKQEFVMQMIERSFEGLETKVYKLKTKISKIKNIEKFKESFEPYLVEINADNRNYLYSLVDGLKNLVEKE